MYGLVNDMSFVLDDFDDVIEIGPMFDDFDFVGYPAYGQLP